MDRSNERLCAHTALIFATFLGLGGFFVTGWFPPLSPALDAAAIHSIFSENTTRIRVGVTLLGAASVFWWTFSAAMAMQLKEIEGHSHPLAYAQMGTASGTVMAVILPAYFWLAAAFRPEIAPGTLQLMNDLSWMMFIGAFAPGVLQALILGVCILKDRNTVKRYPRWVGYFNLWTALLFMPGALIPFFKTGPFTWDGIISFWLVAVIFFSWILLMWWMTLNAIRISESEDQRA